MSAAPTPEDAAAATATPAAAAPTGPVLRIITASTTPEEVAAIVTVLSALGGGVPAAPKPRSEWGNPARGLRQPTRPSSWKASALPR